MKNNLLTTIELIYLESSTPAPFSDTLYGYKVIPFVTQKKCAVLKLQR